MANSELEQYLLSKYDPEMEAAKSKASQRELMAQLGGSSAKLGAAIAGTGRPVDTSFYQRQAAMAGREPKELQQRKKQVAEYLDKKNKNQLELAKLEGDQAYKDKQIALAEERNKLTKSKQEQDKQLKMAELAAKKEKEKLTDEPKNYEQKLAGLKGEERKRFDNASMALEAVDNMAKALAKGDDTFSLVGDNDFTMASSMYEEALGRMQSGGAINAEENVRFRNMRPTWTDSPEIQRKKLQTLLSEMSTRLGSLGFEPQEVMAARRGHKTELPKLQGEKSSNEAIAGDLGGNRRKNVMDMSEDELDAIIGGN
jgi:hypothetical protein